MPNLRHQRVRELLKRELGEIIRREFHVDSVGLITVNEVEPGRDLKSAVVFISVLGNGGQQQRAVLELQTHRIRIQGMVGRKVVLKFTPTLKFVVDDSIVRGNRVLQIIDELEQHSGPAPETDDPEASE